jgi:hypothetical protein
MAWGSRRRNVAQGCRVMAAVFVRISLSIIALALAVAIGGQLIVMTVAPDHDAPPEVERILPDAKSHLSSQLDLHTSVIRYVGWEHRERDQLVILMFELRPFPFISVGRAYLGSRCTPVEELDPGTMGGGRGIVDFATDAELEYLRSDEQPPCG